ncbi:hypothetical protein SLEP1_g40952 [Rubroshorea leprosula]|uniref:RRM domain-containing protein n=1 Tax=Rubroshorea leprosula TaxID=152421 RepID=A0AAV5L5X3_9ROSI|nr:hypothetical protein SLEP1_g40952 [Rubroshorea leprosula]
MARSAAARKDSGYRQRQGYRNKVAEYSSQVAGWSSNFFFYNFPEELEAKFLWNSFQMYGKVVDVYIPRNRDKRGKRYGFVRLTGVKNEIQMERRLNEMWIGSYKMRVKLANDRQRKPSSYRKVHGKPKVSRSTNIMNRLVIPGQTYAQAVKGQGRREDKAPDQAQEKEKNEIPKTEDVKTRAQGNMEAEITEKSAEAEKTEKIVEYTPSGDELKWLEGGMVAVARSMALIPEIQEQMDADGGLISLSPIGGRRVLLSEKITGFIADYMKQNEELFSMWFESITPWEKAPEEESRLKWVRISGVPLKAWGERCFSDDCKISNQVKLKVGEQVYEIEITEEEWRSDPDWWLTENGRRSDLETESDFSNSWCQNEDPEMDMDEMGVGEDVGNDSEHLMKDLISNSNLKLVTETESCFQIVQETDLEGEVNDGLLKEIGPQRVNCDGPIEDSGPTKRVGWGQTKEMHLEEPVLDAQIELNPSETQKSANTTKGNKKQRMLQDCYPESTERIWAKGAPGVTPRTKQRLERRGDLGKRSTGDDKVHDAMAVSISDGCIENRNRVLQREMNMHEVRRIMGVGKRLGFNFENNEEEIQSKLLEAVDREGAERRVAKGR